MKNLEVGITIFGGSVFTLVLWYLGGSNGLRITGGGVVTPLSVVGP
jgi:hypothetical protein